MILGLGHRARSGKDYVAEYLSKQYGFKILHFATAVKREVSECLIIYNTHTGLIDIFEPSQRFNINPTNALIEFLIEKGIRNKHLIKYKGSNKKEPILLQWWGTDFRRAQDEDYWVDQLNIEIQKLIKKNDKVNIVVPDTRFPNEVRFIKSFYKGEVWKIVRLNKDGSVYISPDRDPNHISECALDSYRFDEILSAGSGQLNNLKKQVDKLMKKNGIKKVRTKND